MLPSGSGRGETLQFSNNWRKQKEKLAQLHLHIADARFDYLHKVSSEISKNHAMIVLEDLKVKNLSASARGTVECPGRNVRAKAGLNKAVLDQGWHAFRVMLGYKLAWRGGVLELVPPHHLADLPGMRTPLEEQPPVAGGVSL